VTQPPVLMHLVNGLPVYASLLLALQNITAYTKTIRNRYACSFKAYDWLSTSPPITQSLRRARHRRTGHAHFQTLGKPSALGS
jgi:hypothetical protein